MNGDGHIEKRKGKKKASILLVEDDQAIVSFLCGLLSESYDVAIALDGRNAMEKITSGKTDFNVAVVDYRLPDISGLEILREIKEARPSVPVIFITGYGDENVAVKAFRYGAREYLKKPFDYHQFLNVLDFSLSLGQCSNGEPRRVLTAGTECIASEIVNTINTSAAAYGMQKALIYINNNYMNRLSLEKVANKACVSRYHFSREFRKALGCTMQEYVTRLRMEKAKNLLENSPLSVTDVAFTVGYPNLTNFERLFRKTTGCSPREYRASGRGDAEPEKSQAVS